MKPDREKGAAQAEDNEGAQEKTERARPYDPADLCGAVIGIQCPTCRASNMGGQSQDGPCVVRREKPDLIWVVQARSRKAKVGFHAKAVPGHEDGQDMDKQEKGEVGT